MNYSIRGQLISGYTVSRLQDQGLSAFGNEMQDQSLKDQEARKILGDCGYWIQLFSAAVPMMFLCAEEVFADAVLPKGEMTLHRAGLILILVVNG